MVGSDRVPNLKLIASEPWLDTALVQLERNGALHGVHAVVRSKKNLTPPTLSEMGIFRQSSNWLSGAESHGACSTVNPRIECIAQFVLIAPMFKDSSVGRNGR